VHRPATEKHDKPDPVNLGAGFEISIRDLSTRVAELCGHRGRIVWDPTQPNGQPRRCLDVSRAEREFGFRAQVDFQKGLEETIAWYRGTGCGSRTAPDEESRAAAPSAVGSS
jgi:GDP-L-fucose synthase